MKRILLAAIISLVAANAIAQTPPDSEEAEPKERKERLGVRIGYVATQNGIKNSFGGGMQGSVHWIQRLVGLVSLDFSVGVFSMGETDRTDITRALFLIPPDDVSMRILIFTVAPMVEVPLGGRWSAYGSAGIGLYSISFDLQSGLQTGELTANNFGVNAGGGILWRLSTNWTLDLNGQLHKFWTGGDSGEPFNAYSEGDPDPLYYHISVGAMVAVF